MGREIKGFIIGTLVSGGIHLAILLSPLFFTPALDVKEIPGSIEISLGAYRQPPREKISIQERETKPRLEKIEMAEQQPTPQTEDRIKVTEAEDDTSGESKPDSRGDSTMAIPRQEGNPKPPYPEFARRRGYEGTVRLEMEVLVNGKVGRIWVKESSGYKILDDSALKTIKEEWLLPEHAGSTVIKPVTFKLKDR